MKKRQKIYKILIVLLVMIMAGIGIVKQSNIDKNYGKVNIKEAYVTKTLASVSEANIKNEENIKATDEIKYEIKYKIDGKEKRNVVVEASLRENESKYASFEEIENENIKSTLNEDKSNIKIEIKEVEPNILQTLNLYLIVKNAPNNFKINPSIKIKEATEEKYDTINTKEAVVKTKSITGIIRDETKNGVSNLEIKLVKDNEEVKRTYTDKEGKYTFSDIEEGNYKVDVVEDKYEIIENKNVEVKESEVLDLIVREIKPFNIEVKKYIQKVTINNKTYTYNKINKVNQSVKNLKEINGEIEYKVVIKNIGKKEGIVTKVEESLPEGLKLKEKNGWKNKNGKIRNEEVEGITLKPGEEKELKLEADIEKTKEEELVKTLFPLYA